MGNLLHRSYKKGYVDFQESAKPHMAEGEDFKFKAPFGKIELYIRELKEKVFDPVPKYTKNAKLP